MNYFRLDKASWNSNSASECIGHRPNRQKSPKSQLPFSLPHVGRLGPGPRSMRQTGWRIRVSKNPFPGVQPRGFIRGFWPHTECIRTCNCWNGEIIDPNGSLLIPTSGFTPVWALTPFGFQPPVHPHFWVHPKLKVLATFLGAVRVVHVSRKGGLEPVYHLDCDARLVRRQTTSQPSLFDH